MVALGFAYTNIHGWKPSILITDWGLIELKAGIRGTASLEIWNRRKYPIVVRRAKVRFRDIRFSELEPHSRFPANEHWHLDANGKSLVYWKHETIAPNTFLSLSVNALCAAEGPFPHEWSAHAAVLVYDPKKGRELTLITRGLRPNRDKSKFESL